MNLRQLSVPFVFGLGLIGCSPAPLPAPVSQADAVAHSSAAEEAKELAPQAFAEAEKLLVEAQWLYDQGRHDEAAAAGEEAIAAYSHAFALARTARAEERMEAAQQAHDKASRKLAEMDRLQKEVAADADAFEMRARVHLDTEQVKDVDQLSPDRAKARRLAARQLSSEARLLCLAARILDKDAKGLAESAQATGKLEEELSQGSLKDDLYPRAAQLRSDCLKHLTQARRPIVKNAPESADSDRLLTALTETRQLFAFRDDRGIVVNLGSPMDGGGSLTDAAKGALQLLGGTAKAHPDFPVLLVAHTARRGQSERAKKMLEAASEVLRQNGAKDVVSESVEDAQPVVNASIQGADGKNERIEVVFVVPGR